MTDLAKLFPLGRAAFAAALITVGGSAVAAAVPAERYRPPVDELENYVREPLPPGFSVQRTDVDGPVYVDADGMTLYIWPLNNLRNGQAGDRPNEPSHCEDVKQTVTTGLMSPYPGGLRLPDLDIRPTCTALWPPVYAAEDAKPVGAWTVIGRPDGRKQWAFEGQAVYRSALDKKPGDVIGSSRRWNRGDSGSHREPIGPRPDVPPAFAVRTVATGRLLAIVAGASVYTWDGDGANKSNCTADCLKQWLPVLAPEVGQGEGEWRIIERSRGVRQWTFRGKPLYTHIIDERSFSLEGADVPGWHNVYTQKNPAIPSGFTVQDSRVGEVLADKNGKTIYLYRCSDDAQDQLDCDYPTATQAYRLAVCGRGDAERCNRMFPYVLAPADAKTSSLIWSTMDIDPATGHPAAAGDPHALHVWTFRSRPIYTHALDNVPGEINGDGWGEYNGKRNGYKGFFLRDDFLNNAN
jgi:predicted lipoprotein with Yx(FWY)xxD motif